jgi:hypothetical protein
MKRTEASMATTKRRRERVVMDKRHYTKLLGPNITEEGSKRGTGEA